MRRAWWFAIVLATGTAALPAWPQQSVIRLDDDGFRRLGQCGFAGALAGDPERTLERYSSAAVRIAHLSGEDRGRALALFNEGSDREAERLRVHLRDAESPCIATDDRHAIVPVDILQNAACAASVEAWLRSNKERLGLAGCVWYLRFSINH